MGSGMVKGQLENMMSKARFTEGEFYIQYRDFKELVQLPVKEFWKIAEIVPTHRIARILEHDTKTEEATKETSLGSPLIKVLYESSDPILLALPVTVLNEVDPETLRFVEMRDALGQKETVVWHRYTELERVKRLEEEGRELLGEVCYIQEKRDGENLSIWLESDGTPHVSSHNMVNADPSIVSRLQCTPEYAKVLEFLKNEWETYGHRFIVYGELVNKGKGATRVEPTHKYSHYIVFDIYNILDHTYLPYINVYQHAHHWRLPIVSVLEVFTPYKMEDIDPKIAEWKTWAKRHRREGVVGKVYKNGELLGFKEKIDLPDLPKEARETVEKATFPPMPEDRILRALQHAWDELEALKEELSKAGDEASIYPTMEDIWKDKSRAMPIIAKHIGTEAREHSFNTPRNIFEIYLNTPVDRIKEHPKEEGTIA